MPRGLDHLVLAVRDLDGAGRFYERLGFQVGARNRHPWGTENRLVQFPGAFLELITAGEGGEAPSHQAGRFSFGAFVRSYLSRREGFAMLALESRDAATDARLFAEAGIGTFEPFFFERRGRKPDGAEVHVAFTLAFALDPEAADVGFFVCQQHRPENFWNPILQLHPNGAAALGAVVLATPDPVRHRRFLTVLTGAEPVEASGRDLSFALPRGRLDVMTLDDAAEAYVSVEEEAEEPALVAFSVRVAEIVAQGHRLDAAGIPYQRIGTRLIVPASAAFGVAIAFEPA
ncbi:MAG TPA: VOC family protein [Microvirga sp.]|jgi:catechol 2,3-dioxygenase-like lactoylglutathione lyase family enzyme|nr:VOC family protein [Microvirga sp.]